MTIHMKTLPDTVTNRTQAPPSRPALGHALMRLGMDWYARLSPEGAGRLVNRQFFKPGRLPMPSRYESLLDVADSHTQLHHGTNILPIYSWGEGPTILMVHGWSGAGIQFGAYIEPLVKAGFRAVLFDAPAHGRAQGSSTNLYEIAEVVKRVGLSHGPVHGIIAHSMGSVAAARALSRGLDAKNLVMLAPPSDLQTVVHGLGKRLQLSANVLQVHKRLIEERFGTEVWSELSLVRLAGQLTQRGLVVIDSDDRDVPPALSHEVHLAWPGGHVLHTRGLGHHRMLWNPDVVKAVIGAVASPT